MVQTAWTTDKLLFRHRETRFHCLFRGGLTLNTQLPLRFLVVVRRCERITPRRPTHLGSLAHSVEVALIALVHTQVEQA